MYHTGPQLSGHMVHKNSLYAGARCLTQKVVVQVDSSHRAIKCNTAQHYLCMCSYRSLNVRTSTSAQVAKYCIVGYFCGCKFNERSEMAFRNNFLIFMRGDCSWCMLAHTRAILYSQKYWWEIIFGGLADFLSHCQY